jgi:iron complex transport system substrate-binding protein
VTKWCADVAPVNGLPQLGDCWRLESVDEIAKLRPSLVIGSVPFKAEVLAKLLEQPFNFLAKNPRTWSDIERDVRLLGRIVDRQAQAARLVQKMRTKFAIIEKRARGLSRRLRVYCEAWPKPRISSPPWVAEVVRIAGGEMVVPAGEKVTENQVAEAAPEAMVLAWAATGAKAKSAEAYKIAAWRDVPAIRDRQVYVVRDELLNTPGPPLMEGASELFRIFETAAAHARK